MSVKVTFPYKEDIYVDPKDRSKVIAVVDRPKIPILGRDGFFKYFKSISFKKNTEVELEF